MSKTLKQRPTAARQRNAGSAEPPRRGRRKERSKGDLNALKVFLAMSPLDQSEQIRNGVAAAIVRGTSRDLLNIPLPSLLKSLRLPSSAIHRKIASGGQISACESDRIARTILIHALAKDVFEDSKLAAEWMLKRNVRLGDEKPIEMLDTQTGYDNVRDILTRLVHGVCI
ncbi:DUF2384 domain-containing protein [Paraburkholderia sediminicola]|uniref:antitoxin Xre/MbcA/ParS toxin-binding domain-containing protein n=1 Tax=Paraburkholderia sediminicola TaxID=458836 RepID=UPI0038BE0006